MIKLWTNGSILSLKAKKVYDWILTKDDKILKMGNNDQEPVKYDQQFDLEGKFLMTAFIDTHSHFLANALSFNEADLSTCKSFNDVKEKIIAYIEKNKLKADEWINATGYDHNNFVEKDHPRKTFLDSISKTNPIAIHHQSKHLGVFNSAALEYLNINKDTQQPEGGQIEMNPDGPTGFVEKTAFMENIKLVPLPDMDKIKESILKAQELYFSYGITTAQDGMVYKEIAPIYQEMLKSLNLDIDLIYYASLADKDEVLAILAETKNDYYRHLKFGGVKLFLDGSPQAKTAWLRKPYVDDKNNYGVQMLSDQQLYAGLELAYDNKLQPLVHCNGDGAAQQFLKTLKKLKDNGKDLKFLRPVLIHGQIIGEDQLLLLKELGVIPSFFIAHIKHWGDVHIKNLGIERAVFISPAKSALALDLPITLHQDSPVIKPDMLETIATAVNRRTKNGVQLNREESLTVKEAILSVTKNAAYQYFEEDIKGGLEVGKQADFVVLSENPFKVDHKHLWKIEVLKTVKDGKVVYSKNK